MNLYFLFTLPNFAKQNFGGQVKTLEGELKIQTIQLTQHDKIPSPRWAWNSFSVVTFPLELKAKIKHIRRACGVKPRFMLFLSTGHPQKIQTAGWFANLFEKSFFVIPVLPASPKRFAKASEAGSPR